MRSFFSDLGLFNYMLLLVVLIVIIVGVKIVPIRIHISIISTKDPTIEEKQEQYIKDLDEAVKAKHEELKRKGLLIYRGGDDK